VQMRVVPGALGTLPGADVMLVNVTVLHSSGTTLVFSGYRTAY
jgi:hypothetical protein